MSGKLCVRALRFDPVFMILMDERHRSRSLGLDMGARNARRGPRGPWLTPFHSHVEQSTVNTHQAPVSLALIRADEPSDRNLLIPPLKS